jgi:peroxiredoxin Q/BCP
VKIVGVGFDTPTANAAWAEQESFEFELWTDGDRELATYYGAVDDEDQVNPSRVTKVLDVDGTLVLEYVESIIVGEHPSKVLADCQQLFGQ